MSHEAVEEDEGRVADDVGDELELSPLEEIVEEDTAAAEEEIAAVVEAADQAAEEIPLEFLEEVGEAEPEVVIDLTAEVVEEISAPTAENGPEEASTADLELELDLDLDFDLELEEEPAAAETLAAPGVTAEESVALAETIEEPPLPEELAAGSTETGEEDAALLVDEVLEDTLLEDIDAAEEILNEVVLSDSFPAAEVSADVVPGTMAGAAAGSEEEGPADSAPAPEALADGATAASADLEATEAEPAADPTVLADLEEAEFYFQQGLYDAAEQVLQQLLVRVPDCAEAVTRLEGVQAAVTLAPAPAVVPEPGYHDLTSSLLGDVEDALNRVAADDAEAFSLDAPVAGAVGQTVDQIDSDDGESHFNLGIAYKEMGLLDDAINEFGKALQYPSRALDALTLKGLCLLEKGLYSQAEGVFISGMNILNLSAEEVTGLRYELGVLYLHWERPQQALEAFEAVAEADPFYREVGEQIDDLRKGLGLDKAGDEAAVATTGKKDRVSFV